MNSAEFCKTKEWKEYKDKKWKKLYSVEMSYHYKEWDGEWVDERPTFLDYTYPHPKEGGEVIKCAYCGWYGKNTSERYFVLEHILPVSKFPERRLDDKNITVACNCCNEQKGADVLNPKTLSDIMIQHQKDLLSGKAIEPKKKNKKNPFKKLEWVDGKWKLC